MFRRRKHDLGPPAASAVAERALCVSVIAMLGTIAVALADGTMEEDAAEKYLVESRRWLIREGLASTLSTREKALLATPIAAWTADERLGARGRNEAVGVLLWALADGEPLPPYDTACEQLAPSVPLLAATADFRAAAALRAREEIEQAHAIAELWLWRARAEQPAAHGDAQTSGTDVDAIARQAAALADAEGSSPGPVDDDFPAHGKPFRDLDSGELAVVASITAERHHALDWLAGRRPDWDDATTDG
ncbi:MAG TPA: DUF4272 domain-containing protein [Gaiellales bacterium]